MKDIKSTNLAKDVEKKNEKPILGEKKIKPNTSYFKYLILRT